MARTTKVCHSATCAGTKQPCEVRLVPSPVTPSPVATWVVKCLACDTDHPPDADFVIADGRGWAQAHKAVHGRIPIPLQETP